MEDYIDTLKAAIFMHNICIVESFPELDPFVIQNDDEVAARNTRKDSGDGFERREHMRLNYE